MTIDSYIEPTKLEMLVSIKLKQHGITIDDYPINPYNIIRQEGIDLKEIPIDNANIRGMIVHGTNATGILINKNRSYVSKRFIAMHEISHHWFHPRSPKRVCFEEYRCKRKGVEWQANNAAAYSLMPRRLIFELVNEFNGNIEQISEWLQVSPESLLYRINDLGYMNKVHVNERQKSVSLFSR